MAARLLICTSSISTFSGLDSYSGWQDKYFGGHDDVTREMVLDDSWEDKTGLVKVYSQSGAELDFAQREFFALQS